MHWPFNHIDAIVGLCVLVVTFAGIIAYQTANCSLLRRERDHAQRELNHEAERRIAETERTKIETARADAESIRSAKLTSAISHALDRNVEMQREIGRFMEILERRLQRFDPPPEAPAFTKE